MWSYLGVSIRNCLIPQFGGASTFLINEYLFREKRMKILSTIIVAVTLLVIGFLFLSTDVNNTDSNVHKTSGIKMQDDEYRSQFKRRDFIKERRENRSKEVNREKITRQVVAGRHHEDFMAYSRLDNAGMNPDDFR